MGSEDEEEEEEEEEDGGLIEPSGQSEGVVHVPLQADVVSPALFP